MNESALIHSELVHHPKNSNEYQYIYPLNNDEDQPTKLGELQWVCRRSAR